MVRVEEPGAVVCVRESGGYRLLFLPVVAVAVGGEGGSGAAARRSPFPSHRGVSHSLHDVSVAAVKDEAGAAEMVRESNMLPKSMKPTHDNRNVIIVIPLVQGS